MTAGDDLPGILLQRTAPVVSDYSAQHDLSHCIRLGRNPQLTFPKICLVAVPGFSFCLLFCLLREAEPLDQPPFLRLFQEALQTS